MQRPRLGIDLFPRAGGEGVALVSTSAYEATLHDLLSGYARQRQKGALAHVSVRRRPVLALADARDILTRLVGPVVEWTRLDSLLAHYLAASDERRSVTASSFGALLELVREGAADLRQERPFAPLFVRARGGREDHA
jgi:segregation and condensation protein A